MKDKILGSGALAILLDALLNSFDLLFMLLDVLMGSIDVLFSMTVVTSGYLAPNLDWLDEQLMTNVLVVVAMLYLLHLSMRFKRRVQDETD